MDNNTNSKKSIKIVPKGGIFRIDTNKQESKDNILISYDGFDEDDDAWKLGYTSSFVLNLNEDEINSMSKHDKMNCSTDFLEVVNTFTKSKKLPLKNKRVIYVDVVFVELLYRGNKLGKGFVEDIISYAKENGIEHLILKAHPFVTWKYGFVRMEGKKQLKEDKKAVQSFYEKLGFKFLKKNCDLMYFKC